MNPWEKLTQTNDMNDYQLMVFSIIAIVACLILLAILAFICGCCDKTGDAKIRNHDLEANTVGSGRKVDSAQKEEINKPVGTGYKRLSEDITKTAERAQSGYQVARPSCSQSKKGVRNPRKSYSRADLHGRSVSQACEIAEDLYAKCEHEGTFPFELITGKGNHSQNGPQIKPAILGMAKRLGWKCYVDQRNKGRIIVKG